MSPQTKRWIRHVAVACKLATRRFLLRQARYLFDVIEERLHNAEVQLRADLEQRRQQFRPAFGPGAGAAVVHRAGMLRAPAPQDSQDFAGSLGGTIRQSAARVAAPIASEQLKGTRAPSLLQPATRSGVCIAARQETFSQWEARRAGVLPASPSPRRKHVRLTSAAFDLRFSRSTL